uniref:Putative secreted protein n=1 Tax=Anopheles darlingi TaxID=43151 RepID=A0A2M4DLJ2_ANODA
MLKKHLRCFSLSLSIAHLGACVRVCVRGFYAGRWFDRRRPRRTQEEWILSTTLHCNLLVTHSFAVQKNTHWNWTHTHTGLPIGVD